MSRRHLRQPSGVHAGRRGNRRQVVRYACFDDFGAIRHHAPGHALPWIATRHRGLLLPHNTAGSCAFYRDARLRRLSVPVQQRAARRGRAVPLLRDEETTLEPRLAADPAQIEVTLPSRLGLLGHRGAATGSGQTPTSSRPAVLEVWRTRTNDGRCARISCRRREFCLRTRRTTRPTSSATSTGEVLWRRGRHHRVPRTADHFAWFAREGGRRFETSREAFLGRTAAGPPAALERTVAGTIAHGWQPVGALQGRSSQAGVA
jgi:hypothetical protein